jgi:hypothetical protein
LAVKPVGALHEISAKYMPLYVAEFQVGYNNRMNADTFGTAIEEGRLTFHAIPGA